MCAQQTDRTFTTDPPTSHHITNKTFINANKIKCKHAVVLCGVCATCPQGQGINYRIEIARPYQLTASHTFYAFLIQKLETRNKSNGRMFAIGERYG